MGVFLLIFFFGGWGGLSVNLGNWLILFWIEVYRVEGEALSTSYHLIYPSIESILIYSVLFYSILILFYSILF